MNTGCHAFNEGKDNASTNCTGIQDKKNIIRTCEENEHSNDLMTQWVLPFIIISALVMSVLVSKCLQVFGDDLELYGWLGMIRSSVIKDLMTAKYQIERPRHLEKGSYSAYRKADLKVYSRNNSSHLLRTELQNLIKRADSEILNCQDKSSGDGCLHLAFFKGYYDLVKTMIDNGGNPTMENKEKESVSGLIEQKQNEADNTKKFKTWNGSEMFLRTNPKKNTFFIWTMFISQEAHLSKKEKYYQPTSIQEEVMILLKIKEDDRRDFYFNCRHFTIIRDYEISKEEHNNKLEILVKGVSEILQKSAQESIWSIVPLERSILTDLKWIKFLLCLGGTLKSKNLEGQTPWQMFQIQCMHCQYDKLTNSELQDAVRLLIKHGANVNEGAGPIYNTPLHFAVREDYFELVSLLLENRANVNATNKEGTMPLHLAKSEEVGRFLIDKGAIINADTSEGKNVLHLAENEKIFEMLIQKGVEVDEKDNYGNTPLHMASLRSKLKIAEILIEKGAKVKAVNSEGKNILHLAKDENFVEMLIQKGAEVDKRDNEGNTPLHIAASTSKLGIAKILIEKEVKLDVVNYERETALHLALGNEKMYKILIEAGANINMKNQKGNTPLHIAAFTRNSKVVKYLVGKELEVNAVNDEGKTALHLALDNEEMFKILIKAGADINIKDHKGNTPLHIAAFTRNSKVVKYLVGKEINLNAVNDEGQTALHLATISEELLQILIEAGADINMKDPEGNTPLHLAALRGNLKTAEYLVKKGAKVNVVSNKGNSALFLVLDNEEMFEILVEYGADINVWSD
jgi:ankyrin repeat protein